MPSRISKKPPNPRSPWKSEPDCSEKRLEQAAGELARALRPGDRVLLEGELGVGKTIFARALLLALGVTQPPEGSPSFAIAHEYRAKLGRVVHVDFYRIRSEAEIDEAGIPEFFWENPGVTLAEWTSLWPRLEKSILERGRCWTVRIAFVGDPDRRDLEIRAPG